MYELVRDLNSSLFRKYVACPIQKPFYSLYAEIGVNAIPLPVRAFSLVSFIKLIIYARVNNIDIIHSHGKGAGFYGRPLGAVIKKPVVHTFHGIHYEKYSFGKQRLYFLLERIMSTFTRYIINVSESEYAEGIRLGLFSESVAKVIYNGVETERLHSLPVDLKTKKMIDSIGTENTLICTVARFDYVKGIDVAIQAVKYLKEKYENFRYIVVGDGELMDEIVKEINESQMNEHVTLLGFRDDVPGILGMMDIYLSPSRSESMSLTILEAMNTGLPVVATDIPGNRDLLKDGVLAKSEDPLDIARKLYALIENQELRDQLAKEGRMVINERFNLKRMVFNTEKLYCQLLKEEGIVPFESTLS